MRHLGQRHGFTLIETILVIILIGVLAAIIIPKFGAQADRARIARTKANIVSIRSAIRIYQADHDGKPPAKLLDLVPDYLPTMPLEAITEQAIEKVTLDGIGGWVYDGSRVLVNLSGTDAEGMDYSKY